MSNSIEQLISALCCLPGIGPKSAQRMTYNLLERKREAGLHLAESLKTAIDKVQHCTKCRNLCESDLCHICSSTRRDQSLLCIVETPADVLALEQTNSYNGLYFVLMGHLSPLDGIGPKELGIEQLRARITIEIKEIILATNPTVEGEATAHYISNLVKNQKIKCTRIAHGVPMGGELEYLDGNTLARAFLGRQRVTTNS
ncbi:MAG: recombination protein RecR [Gammaproteobacteria bacterium]|nr:recombination protein RecR [Gammaproteobacteria bacterium]